MLHVVGSPVYPGKLFHRYMLNIRTLLIAFVVLPFLSLDLFIKALFSQKSPAQCCTDLLQDGINFREL